MGQFNNGATVVTIDGIPCGIGLVKIERSVDVLDKMAKRTLDGGLQREILGVYHNYKLTFGNFWDMSQYRMLFNKLTEKKEFHNIRIATSSGYSTFIGYIAKVHDVIEYVNGDERIVTGLTCDFVAKDPTY